MHDSPARRLWEALVGHRRDDDMVAMVFDADGSGPRKWTGRGLADVTEVLGARLRAQGIGPGSLVGVLSLAQETQAVHYLAVLAAGATPAILTPPTARQEPEHARRTLAGVLAAVRPHAVLTDLPHEALPVVSGSSILRTWTAAPVGSARAPAAATVPPNVAFVQFSSGTTGLKKGVVVTYEAVMTQIRTYAAALSVRPPRHWDGGRVREGDAIASWLPLYHDMGFLTALHLPLATGIPVAMIDPVGWASRPASYLRVASDIGATLGWHPNFAFQFMASRVRDSDLEGVDLSRLRVLANCSEPTTWVAQRRFAHRFRSYGLDEGALAGCYAMAETTFAVTHGGRSLVEGIDPNPPDGAGERRPMVSVGRALPGVDMTVCSADGTRLSDRQVGEIWVRAPFLASGYLDNPEASRGAFVDGWYRTGDLGYRDGLQWYVNGRCKDLLIVAGHNVFPGDVEAIVGEMPGFKPGRVAAFAEFEEATQSERVVVLAEPDGSGDTRCLLAARQRLSAELSLSRLAVHMVPPGWLIKSSSGKMARRACAEKWCAAKPQNYLASHGAIEELV